MSANLCALAVGTETDGSVLAPASINGIVGIKPTVGLVSRTGIVPIMATQDTAGPLGRTVEDAAALLTVLAAVDPSDKAAQAKARPKPMNYAEGLIFDALKGARLGVVCSTLGENLRTRKLFDAALATLKAAGAMLVEGLELPKVDEEESLLYELKAGLADYLKTRRPESPHRTLADIIAFNEKNAEREMPWFGQDLFLKAEKKGPLIEPAYKAARAKDLGNAKIKGIDAVMAKDRLDALVTLTVDAGPVIDLLNGDNLAGSYGCQHAAIAGYPGITVPVGDDYGLPIGLYIYGRAWSEAQLIRYAYAFEQATNHRKVPQLLPTTKFG